MGVGSIASANLGNTSRMPSHPPAEEGPVSGSLLQDTNVFLSPRFPTLYPGQAPDPVSAFLEPGCETGLSFVVSTSGGAGRSVLTTAGPWASLGQKRRPSCRTQSWPQRKLWGTEAQSSRWVELLALVSVSPTPPPALPHTPCDHQTDRSTPDRSTHLESQWAQWQPETRNPT